MPRKRIADPVHGTIDLTDAEVEVISTPAFQRLRNVKQLGLAALVFPGADYSRFSHSVGACHVTGRILDALRNDDRGKITADEYALYRMAALLHDVGHYPFSHTFENALKDYYAETSIIQVKDEQAPSRDPDDGATRSWMHDSAGKHVILNDGDIRGTLDAYGLDAEAIARVVTRAEPPRFANLVSSDLDADRIDYLLRTAHHTGLPYGSVDIDYLLSEIALDNNSHICFTSKAMRSAEHLLLCRYFDYQQVSYHKTVAGLEKALADVVAVLLKSGRITCSQKDVAELIASGGWAAFDDAYLTAKMREALNDTATPSAHRSLLLSVLNRRPPKLLADFERFVPVGDDTSLKMISQMYRQNVDAWRSDLGIEHWWLWTSNTKLTKIGSKIPVPATPHVDDETYDAAQQAVTILQKDGSSKPIATLDNSLMKVLDGHGLYAARVYALVDDPEVRERAEVRVRNDLAIDT